MNQISGAAMPAAPALPGVDPDTVDPLFAAIADDIERRGLSINPAVLGERLAAPLAAQLDSVRPAQFQRAGIGRDDAHQLNRFVRSDSICWIDGGSPAGKLWLDWTEQLRCFLNRRLFLGLFSFESHYAHYRPGDSYRRHFDAFRGEANRVLSVVLYLNAGWSPADGGELVLYRDAGDGEGIRVTPLMGTLVVFLSENFPHEVLPAARDRYSVSGWYRVNASQPARPDPPR